MPVHSFLLRRLGLLASFGLVLIAPVFGEAPAARLPLETFFAEADVRGMQMSPDGRYVAFLTTLGYGKVGIALMDLTTGKTEALVSAQDENIKQFFWKGSDRIVYGGDIGGDESYAWRSVSIEPPAPGKKRKVVAISEAYRERYAEGANFVDIRDSLRFDPQHVLAFARQATGSSSVGMYLTDVRDGRRRLATNFTPPAAGNVYLALQDIADVADNTGTLRARTRVEMRTTFIEVFSEADHGYVKVKEFPSQVVGWDLQFFAADNETLYLLSNENTPTTTLHAYNIRKRELGPALFNAPDGEIEEVLTSYDRSKLTGVLYNSDKPHYHFFDAARAKLQEAIDGALPGTFNRIVSSSADEKMLVIVASSDRDPGTYYIFDRVRGKLGAVAKVRGVVNPAQMRPMEPIAFRARDGLTIHGYLTRPAGDGPVPLIVHPHGGPYGIRDDWGYDPEVQFLANRGYAVLQINYRGSGGYGSDFLAAGFHEWGGKMQDDLTDGVRWALDQHIADPKRVAIYGASYGGYATLAGLVFTPELYCCGANYVGASDLGLLAQRANESGAALQNFYRDQMGDDSAYIRSRSPVNFVERIRVPLFNAYGYNDPRVDIRHWTKLESKLKQYKKDYEILIEDNEGHGFRNEANRIAYFRRLEAFFDRNLAGPGSVRMEDIKVLEMPAKPKS